MRAACHCVRVAHRGGTAVLTVAPCTRVVCMGLLYDRCHRVNYNGRDSFARQYNWFSFFCDTLPQEAVSRKLVAECTRHRPRARWHYRWHSQWPTLLLADASTLVVPPGDGRRTRCFTSFDSNWSNNPFIIDRQYIFNGEKVRGASVSRSQCGVRVLWNQGGGGVMTLLAPHLRTWCAQGGNIAKIALWSSSQKSNAYFEVNELKDSASWRVAA